MTRQPHNPRIDDPRTEHVAQRIADPAWHLLSKNSRRNWLITAAAAIAALQEFDAAAAP